MPVNVNDIEPDEKIVEIEMERLRSFHNHPFKVKADAEMLQLMESISKYGVMNPLIVRCVKEEFLTFGYEKASLNRVSSRVGITTAGLYKHFKNKEDMFYCLVKDTLDAVHSVTEGSIDQMETEKEYNPFDADWAMFWVDFIYEHYDGVKLLICCAKGSVYENFEEELIRKEAGANREYANMLRDSGRMEKEISDLQWHILATAYVHLIFEVVRHDMTRKEANEHMQFVRDLLYPGWRQIYGL